MNFEIVEYALVAIGVIYILIEILLNLNDVEHDTSNVIILNWSQGKAIFIPFAIGAVGGHLLLGVEHPLFESDLVAGIPNELLTVIMLFVLCGILWIIGAKINFEKSRVFMMSLFVLGLMYGHLFWSMNYK